MSFKLPAVIASLKEALLKNKLAHGLLFAGPSGAGQKEAALVLAKTLFCRQPLKQEPCGECPACRQVENRSHPDLVILEPGEDSRFIKIEEVRQLIAKAALKPFSADAKVFVIDPAEAMNDAAQNAFLKTLEEPQGKVFFILISQNPKALLPTIHSRLQRFWFASQGFTETLSAEEEFFKKQILATLLEGLAPPDLSKLERQAIVKILEAVIGFLREALLLSAGAGEILGAAARDQEKEAVAAGYDPEWIYDQIERLAEFKEKINENINAKLAMNVLLGQT
jgi:DNA polymerase III delta' subunit